MKELRLPKQDLTNLDYLSREELYEYIELLKRRLVEKQARIDQINSDRAWELQAARGGQM